MPASVVPYDPADKAEQGCDGKSVTLPVGEVAAAAPVNMSAVQQQSFPLSVMLAMLGEKGKGGELAKRIQGFDKDGNGVINATEFRVALEQEYHSHLTVQLLWTLLTIALVALTASVAATVGLTYWVVQTTKEVKSDNHNGLLVSASTGQPVQTGDMRGYVDLPAVSASSLTNASTSSGRRRVMLSQANVSSYCDSEGVCPAALSTCHQGRDWFDMLLSAKTVSDVILQFSTTDSFVISARAIAFTTPPKQPTIEAYTEFDSSQSSNYIVKCPDRLLAMSSSELDDSTCVCPVFPSSGTAAAPYSSQGVAGGRRRSLASLQAAMAAGPATSGGFAAAAGLPRQRVGSGGREVHPLLSLSCADTYRAAVVASHHHRSEGHISMVAPGLGLPVFAKFTLPLVSASAECSSGVDQGNGGGDGGCAGPRPGTGETHGVLSARTVGPRSFKLGDFQMVCPFLLPGLLLDAVYEGVTPTAGGSGGLDGHSQGTSSNRNSSSEAAMDYQLPGTSAAGLSGAAAGGSRGRCVLVSGPVEPSSLALADDELPPALAAWVGSDSCHCHLYPLSKAHLAVRTFAAGLGTHKVADRRGLFDLVANQTACKSLIRSRIGRDDLSTPVCEAYPNTQPLVYRCCGEMTHCYPVPLRDGCIAHGAIQPDSISPDGIYFVFNDTQSHCFPAGARVAIASLSALLADQRLRSYKYKAVEELQPGDLVLVVDGSGKLSPSAVEFFGHRDAGRRAMFLELETASGHTLILSPGHFVYASSNPDWSLRRNIKASLVRPGDYLFVLPPGSADQQIPAGPVVPSRVVAVRRTSKRGLYAFHTAQYAGRVVVEGVVASEFTDALPPALAQPGKWLLRQAVLNPARLWGLLPHSEALQQLLSGPLSDAGRAVSVWVRQQLRSWGAAVRAAGVTVAAVALRSYLERHRD